MSNCKYPWKKWFSRKRPFKLYYGVDFDCMPHSMAVQIRHNATERGFNVSVKTKIQKDGDTALIVEMLD